MLFRSQNFSLWVEADTQDEAITKGWQTPQSEWTPEPKHSDEFYVSSVTKEEAASNFEVWGEDDEEDEDSE